MPDIHEESVQSLFLTLMVRGQRLSSATGFVVEDFGVPFLVTNWHVLSGRDVHTGEPLSKETGAVPDTVVITHNAPGRGNAVEITEYLWDPEDPDHEDAVDRVPRWTGHPAGPRVDVAVLPLTSLDGVRLIPHHLPRPGTTFAVSMEVTSEVSIVGFPFGLTHAKKLGIWTRGTVATEYDVDYDDLPCFLIDARTRRGQSGSPVLYFNPDASTVRLRGGAFTDGKGSFSRLLGLYSGRVNEESDLGYVWRPHTIVETVAAAFDRGNVVRRQ